MLYIGGGLCWQLHHLVVVYTTKVKSTPRELIKDGNSADAVVEDLGVVENVVWLQFGESEVQFKEKHLSWCLVG